MDGRQLSDSLRVCLKYFINTSESARQLSSKKYTDDSHDDNRKVVAKIFNNDPTVKFIHDDHLLGSVKQARAVWSANVKHVPWAIRYAYEVGLAAGLYDNLHYLHREVYAYPKESVFRSYVATVLDGLVQPWMPWLTMHASRMGGVKKTLELQNIMRGIAVAIEEHLQSTKSKMKKFFTKDRKRSYKHYEQKLFKQTDRAQASGNSATETRLQVKTTQHSAATNDAATQPLLAPYHPPATHVNALISTPASVSIAQNDYAQNSYVPHLANSFRVPEDSLVGHRTRPIVASSTAPTTAAGAGVTIKPVYSHHKSNTWLILGILTCSLVVIVIGVILAIHFAKRKSRDSTLRTLAAAQTAGQPVRIIRVPYVSQRAWMDTLMPYTPGSHGMSRPWR